MKKKKTPTAVKRTKSNGKAEKEAFPDQDPEWEHLEERYADIGSEMRKLAALLEPK